MPRSYARFMPSPIGDGQAVESAGYEVVSQGAILEGHARGDIPSQGGRAGVEWVFYGADDDMTRIIGLVDEAVAPTAIPGTVADSVGWDLEAGELRIDGELIESGVPVPPLNSVVGMLLDETMEPPDLTFYAEGDPVLFAFARAGAWLTDENGIYLFTNDGFALGDKP